MLDEILDLPLRAHEVFEENGDDDRGEQRREEKDVTEDLISPDFLIEEIAEHKADRRVKTATLRNQYLKLLVKDSTSKLPG